MRRICALLILVLILAGCGSSTEITDKASEKTEETVQEYIPENIAGGQESANKVAEVEKKEEAKEPQEKKEKKKKKKETLTFQDANKIEYEMEINPNVPANAYDPDGFEDDNGLLSYYENGKLCSRLGIDVSKYQKDVKWDKVKASGIEFAFIRIGYRGYSGKGDVHLDPMYERHIEGAMAAGLDVGVYFFSQAVNEEEAIEEAEFVIKHIRGYELTCPVVYDPEEIKNDAARTDEVTPKQFTKNTKAFCKTVTEAGYEAMVYTNMKWEGLVLNMEKLSDYKVWYADYIGEVQTPYHFDYWQYTGKGRVDGISGAVDLNIQIIR